MTRCGVVYFDDGTFFPARIHCQKTYEEDPQGWKACYEANGYIVYCCPEHIGEKRVSDRPVDWWLESVN